MKRKTGLLGELLVELKLVELGWHVARLNAQQVSVNTDLIAIKGDYRVSIQVKTTDGSGNHTHADSIHFGRASAYLRDGTPFFNTKIDPLTADVVVGVNYKPDGSRFIVLPVGLAETLCRKHADYWSSVAKRDGKRRADEFPIYMRLHVKKNPVVGHHDVVQRTLLAHENRWDLLTQPQKRLRDSAVWPLSG